MSVHVFFSFSAGLKSPIIVPNGTKSAALKHVAEVEAILSIKRRKDGEGPDYNEYWDHWEGGKGNGFRDIDDKILCKTVQGHNHWVRWLYDLFERCSAEPPSDGETITPEEAAQFWPGLELLSVPPARWTPDYYRDRMDALYETMRGRESEGRKFDTKALTPKQAANVIFLFAEFLDSGDLRLDVPHGHDYLASSYDGGYDWCGECGRAIAPDDIGLCRRRKCELREEDA